MLKFFFEFNDSNKDNDVKQSNKSNVCGDKICLNSNRSRPIVKFNNSIKWFIPSQHNTNTLVLATCFGLYKTIFRPMLTTGRYIMYVHTECTSL